MRPILAVIVLSCLAMPAGAQSPAPAMAVAASAPAATPPARTRQTLEDRFAAANITHDGKLTLDQAKAAKWTTVTRNFAAIDKAKKGYVTVTDIRAEEAARRETHKAATTTPKT